MLSPYDYCFLGTMKKLPICLQKRPPIKKHGSLVRSVLKINTFSKVVKISLFIV